MKVNIVSANRIIKSVALLAVTLSLSCSSKPNKPGGSIINGSNGENGGPGGATNFPVEVSLQAYKKNLYESIVEPNCAKCHHTEDNLTLEASHEYMLGSLVSGDENDNGLIVFKAPKQSVFFKRVESNHNCVSENCKVDIVESAIKKWAEEIEKAGYKIEFPKYDNQTDDVSISQAKPIEISIDASEYAFASAAQATGAGTMATPGSGSGDGKLDQYFESEPLGNPLAQGDAAAGTVEFPVEISTAGTYFLQARMNVPNDNENQMFFIVEQNGQQVFNSSEPTFESSGDAWVWNLVRDQNANDDDDDAAAIALEAGPATIRVQEGTGGTKVSYVVLTTRPDPNLEQFVTQYYDIAVDISKVSGVANSKIVATIWKKAQEEAEVKAVGVSNLRIQSSKPLKVKGIKPIIGKLFDPSHSTFTVVDTVAGGSDPAKQNIDTGGASGSTWIADFSKDSLGFAFDEIGPAE